MRIAAVLVAATLVAPHQDEGRSVEEEIAALIEKTNALETFHAIYDMEIEYESKQTRMTIELIYQAPGLGRLHASGSVGDHDYWVTSEVMYTHDSNGWRAATIESVPAASMLYERFPETQQAVEGGVCVAMNMAISDSGEPEFQLVFQSSPWGRACVLGWLQMLQRRTGIKAQDSSLVWEEEGLQCRVSRETGLLEEASIESEKGRGRIRLREGRVDCDLAPELLALPDAALNAQVDSDLTLKLAFNRNRWRRLAFLHVESLVASGQRDWSELVRNDWREVMDALHRQAIVKSYAKSLAELRTQIETRADSARKDVEKDSSQDHIDEVRKQAAEQRAKMDEALVDYETRYIDSLPVIESDRYEPRQDLFDTEKEVIDDLWDELVQNPLLDFYDEKFSEALGK